MNAFVFAGPSLAGAALPEEIADLPPACQGDIYRAAQQSPRAIGIVDGYFEGVPSVWHKEILWALSRGISVYGSGSIGALRAAELHPFGMIGVGVIFAAYRDGTLEADDEVALLHGPPETGFLALTEPLVNVRATCAAAEAAGILAGAEGASLVATAAAIFYKERTWNRILARARAAGMADDRVHAFEHWLAGGRVDQKQLDALDMIERMRSDLASGSVASQRPEFEPTFLWERAVASWSEPSPERSEQSVLDEIRLDPDRYLSFKARARHRMQALRQTGAIDAEALRRARVAIRKRHCMTHGLLRAADLDAWLAGQGLDRGQYERLIDEEALAELLAASEDRDLVRVMIALLKFDGEFAAAAERAAAKATALAEGARKPARRPLSPPLLLDWFFRRNFGRQAPEDIDAVVRALGLASREAFYRLLADEHLYLAASDEDQTS